MGKYLICLVILALGGCERVSVPTDAGVISDAGPEPYYIAGWQFGANPARSVIGFAEDFGTAYCMPETVLVMHRDGYGMSVNVSGIGPGEARVAETTGNTLLTNCDIVRTTGRDPMTGHPVVYYRISCDDFEGDINVFDCPGI